jgi:hypothetical protein
LILWLSAETIACESAVVDVRRLAAIDMHGLHGTARRRRLVLAEFVLGTVALVVIGTASIFASDSIIGRIVGWWMMGAGLNYALLAVHAVRLCRPWLLAEELAGVDVGSELRRYTILQLWIFVPLLLVIFQIAGRAARRGSEHASARR